DAARVDVQDHVWPGFEDELDVRLPCPPAKTVAGGDEELGARYIVELERRLTGFDLGKVEEVIYEAAHPNGLLVDDRSRFHVVGLRAQGAVDHCLGETLN